MQQGTFILSVSLTDAKYPSTIGATFENVTILILSQPVVQVNSGPPYFSTPLVSTITVELNSIYELVWPEVKDPDIADKTYTMSVKGLA